MRVLRLTFIRVARTHIEGWFEHRVPQWSVLRSVGNSHVVRLTILVPLIGYMVIFNERLLPYIELSKTIFGTSNGLESPLSHGSWRLLFAYFGLTFVAIASVVYQFRCPQMVKTYATVEEYISAMRPNVGDFMLEVASKNLQSMAEWKSELYFSSGFGVQKPDDSMTPHQRDRYNSDVLGMNYLIQDVSRLFWRFLTSALYFFGFALLLAPSVNVFIAVIRVLFRT